MIDKIKLKFGSTLNKPLDEISAKPTTIFVGPNNSGKSRVLIEIERFCKQGVSAITDVILDRLVFSAWLNPEEEIKKYTLAPYPQEVLQVGNIMFGKGVFRMQIAEQTLVDFLKNPSLHLTQYCNVFVSTNTIRLDGQSRMGMINPQVLGDLQQPPQNNLAILFKDNAKRKEVRRIIYDAFKRYFVLDPTNPGNLRIRLSAVEPQNEMQELGLHEDAVQFHSKAFEITLASDGVKAFTGIITTLIAGDPNVIIIDEPEAFLHPSLATNLGKEVSNSVNGSLKNLFVSTHSASFLMGCIQSGAPINIIRLTYSNNSPTARTLPSEKVLKLMRHPLLRSTGVLNGLFYEYVIVTEADADRALYQEINERLLLFDPSRGIPNCLFLNAQNKQTIHEIMKPLRKMGIPCAAIVDVDVLKEGGTNWSNLLGSAFIPGVTIQATTTSRAHIIIRFNDKVNEEGKVIDFKVKGGVNVLDDGDKEACNNLFDQLDEYGIFVVRQGELESWLKNLDVTASHSPKWLIEIFEKLGEDPNVESYIRPTKGDVWEFLAKIKTWLFNPERKGIPE